MISEAGIKEYYCDSKNLRDVVRKNNKYIIDYFKQTGYIFDNRKRIHQEFLSKERTQHITHPDQHIITYDGYSAVQRVWVDNKFSFHSKKKDIRKEILSLFDDCPQFTNIEDNFCFGIGDNYLEKGNYESLISYCLKNAIPRNVWTPMVKIPKWVWTDFKFAAYFLLKLASYGKSVTKIETCKYAGGSFTIYLNKQPSDIIQYPFWKKNYQYRMMSYMESPLFDITTKKPIILDTRDRF